MRQLARQHDGFGRALGRSGCSLLARQDNRLAVFGRCSGLFLGLYHCCEQTPPSNTAAACRERICHVLFITPCILLLVRDAVFTTLPR
jgi:hypothetical protein